MSDESVKPAALPSVRRLARVVFTTFLLTFIVSRLLVILIMERAIPDFFLHLGGTHVHHLNYGIFLLAMVGALLLFRDLGPVGKRWCAVAYGFGLALTFDEFGMWLHLGGGYWQRASYDGVIVVMGLLGIIAFWPPLSKMRAHHWVAGGVIVLATALFYLMLFQVVGFADTKYGPRLQLLEQNGPA